MNKALTIKYKNNKGITQVNTVLWSDISETDINEHYISLLRKTGGIWFYFYREEKINNNMILNYNDVLKQIMEFSGHDALKCFLDRRNIQVQKPSTATNG